MNIHAKFEEAVNGVVIGAMLLTCSLRYEGRQQGGNFYAETKDEAVKKAKQLKAEILADCAPIECLVYPLDDAWELRIHE